MNDITTPIVENIEMTERYINVYFSCTLAGVPVHVTGSYNVGLNAFNVGEVSGQSVEELCAEMGWDEDETAQSIQEAFEHR